MRQTTRNNGLMTEGRLPLSLVSLHAVFRAGGVEAGARGSFRSRREPFVTAQKISTTGWKANSGSPPPIRESAHDRAGRKPR